MDQQKIEQFKELNELLSQGEMADQPKTLEFVGGLVANRCYQDEEFAKTLRADPDATVRELAREVGIELSDDLKIVARENNETTWHVPAPSAAMLDKMQKASLSDAQMAQVSGGEILIAVLIGGAVAAGGAAITTAVATGVAVEAEKRKNPKNKKKK